MKYPIYLCTTIFCLTVLNGCNHKIEMPKEHQATFDPSKTDINLGSGRKRIELRSPKDDRLLLKIDVTEDERKILINKDTQDVRIRQRP